MDRIWLKSYPAGVPAEIDASGVPSLKFLCEKSFAEFAAQAAYVQMGHAMSYAELDGLSARFAAWLQKGLGLRKGDRLALMMPNLLQYPVALFGALRAGLVVVNTNPLYTAPELEHQLRDSGACAIVILENFCHVLERALPATLVTSVIVTGVGDLLPTPKRQIVNFVVRRVRRQVPRWRIANAIPFNTALAGGRKFTLDPVELAHEDLAFLQYTGGTTGVAKAAMLTHGNMVANVLQSKAWFASGLLPESTYIVALPLYHIFSLTGNALLFMVAGGRGILIPNARDFPAFVAELVKYPPNFLMGVNTLFNALMHTPGFERIDFTRLRATIGGGMAVQAAIAARWKAMTGCVLSQGWGLTETSPVAAMNPLDGRDFNGSIGLPAPSTVITIRDDAGRELALGELGEICVSGPQVMKGYYHRPDETAQVMLPDGALRTGDIGRMDDEGFVYIEDRKKDMILVSGFNVYPNEVEGVVVTHPGVLEAAAVAEPDERSGEVVALFVVRKDQTLTEQALIEFCRESLTAYKVPRHVYFRADLPKTNVGKILRRALRDELRAAHQGERKA
jgi:long-chain acyl-CoA synthetase